MELAAKSIVAFCMLLSPFMVSANTCTGPQVDSSFYTTTEASSSSDTVFIVQFSLACKNGVKNINLYADVNGKTMQVTRAESNSQFPYQVSFSDENKNLPAGKYEVKFYDEDGYSNLRKAQRSGESSSVPALFSISVNHPGVWKGPMVQTEFVAATVSILVWYLAYTARTKLQSS